MKYIIPSLAVFTLKAAAAEADYDYPLDLTPKKFNSIVTMAYSQITTSWTRDVFEKRINKYGCHCFPNGTKSAGGSGTAVDPIDAACKQLYKCHKCVELTWGDDAVDVDTGRYTWGTNDDGTLNCDRNANNPSRKALCECDRAFAYNLASVWADDQYNDFYWKANRHVRNNPTFDYDSTCVNVGNGGGAADQCCGTGFPNMEPFNSSERSCCVSSVYNILTSECCTDGHVASIGSC